MFVCVCNKKENLNLKESNEVYMRGFGDRKEKEEGMQLYCNLKIIRINKNVKHINNNSQYGSREGKSIGWYKINKIFNRT